MPIHRTDFTQRNDDPRLAEAGRLSCRGKPASAFALAVEVYEEAFAREDHGARAAAACDLSWFCIMLSRTEEGVAFAHIAIALCQESGDRAGESRARACCGWLLTEIGDPDAMSQARLALLLAQQCGEAGLLAFAHNCFALVLYTSRQHDLALQHSETSVRLARETGNRVAEGCFLVNLGLILSERTEVADGAHLRRAAEITRAAMEIGVAELDAWITRISVCNLAEFMHRLGEPLEARALLARHADAGGESGPRDALHHTHTLATFLIAEGQHDLAETELRRCVVLAAQTKCLQLQVQVVRDLAAVLALQQRFEEAYETHRHYHALTVAQSTDGAQRRARALAIQHNLEQLGHQVEVERSRAKEVELSNLRLTEEMERLLDRSLRDPLTGLANRRRLDEFLAQLDAGGARYALAMIDIDHFKQVNDRFSHMVGDAVLRQVGCLLREHLREPDLTARYGGEEFTAVIMQPDLTLAYNVCERLRHAISTHPWFNLKDGLAVTISIGLAMAYEATASGAVLQIADQRLYRAKQSGRNRVEPA